MTDNLLSGGMIIYSDVIKCPFCDDEDPVFEEGFNECRRCKGKFTVERDEEQDIFIIEKNLR